MIERKEINRTALNPNKELYNMSLFEIKRIYFNRVVNTLVKRVPGGWIMSGDKSDVFVPFNNEFQSQNK